MKNKFEVQREIRRIEEEVSAARGANDKRKESSGLKKLEFLKQVRMYLETDPSEEYLKKTLESYRRKKKIIENLMDKEKPKFYNEMVKKTHDYSNVCRVVNNITFILS